MFKHYYGFDPKVFEPGTAISLRDNIKIKNVAEFSEKFQEKNRVRNYLVKQCFISELWLTDFKGKEIKLHFEHVEGDNPKMTITKLS